MQPEIEAKFLNVNHDEMRAKLKTLGAVCEKPLRTMRRTVFDFADGRIEASRCRLRVRDEGDKVTITFKDRGDKQYEDEIETTVGSYETMVELLQKLGLQPRSERVTRRETWRYQNVEVVLDEWPWIKPCMEIEGTSEADIKACAEALGLDWKDAGFGSVETAYRAEYPGIGPDEHLGDIGVVDFDRPVPPWLEERRQPR